MTITVLRARSPTIRPCSNRPGQGTYYMYRVVNQGLKLYHLLYFLQPSLLHPYLFAGKR